jgi:dTDP-4-dehydrorhamnose reductase
MDQLELSGHRTRLSDLDLIAELGVRKLRYPVLWESVAPESLDQPNWNWADERLPRLQELGVDPIVGLLHHGSGPRYTAMNADNFVEGLARFAGMVAERYPWVNYYTPVNEPLTTARFSGLYGLWYPHTTDDRSFVRMLLNEIFGTRAAMKAIRKVNPKAKLVQTEDMGKVHSTERMSYQAEFENHRRWLTFDLLCGQVDASHPLWRFLRANGATKAELFDLVNDPMPPDVMGINYYVTSERFLDHDFGQYPPRCFSRNHKDRYADVEAVRVLSLSSAGIKNILTEVWERYKLPIAITESHLGCTREEQMRWILEAWDAANLLRNEGVNIRALTVWSLLGAFDWDSLLTRRGGSYESGVFDVRSGQPRPTALFKMVQSLARSGRYTHPVLAGEGWWQRSDRFVYRTSPIV